MAIRVIVVDDSAFMRKIISDTLNSDQDIQVVYAASNGKEALEKIKQYSPDVVTLDVEMPTMDGLDCLKHIMRENPLPVIMISSLTSEGAEATLKALELGAIDFITKPQNIFEVNTYKFRDEVIKKIKIARSSVVAPYTYQLGNRNSGKIKHNNSLKKIIAIGTSTGGPRALQQVIPFIPGNIPAAFIVVQHMPPGFTKSLAARLDSMSELSVKEAKDGDVLQAGNVYIAPGDYHLILHKEKLSGHLVIHLDKGDYNDAGRHRPSVNVMMNSLADTGFKNIIGIIMTGMGNDGCEGLKKLKEKNNAYIIAQNEESCVVYGMPKAAVNAGIVDKIVSLDEISNVITKMVGV